MTNWLGIAIGVALVGAWQAWKMHRNSLPDEQRAQLFWNDQRYERLQFGITAFLWAVVAAIALFGLWFLGIAWGWWD